MDKKKKKKKRNKYIERILAISTLIVSVIALGVSCSEHNINQTKLQPEFSLNTEQDGLDLLFNIYNSGGSLVNGKLKPSVYLVLGLENEYYSGTYRIKFTDFYSEMEYFYDAGNNCFLIQEIGMDKLYMFMVELNNYLAENGIIISYYSIQNYFEMAFQDYNKKQYNNIYEVYNNHNYYLWDSSDKFVRYFSDNALRKITEIDDYDIEMPIVNPKAVAEDITNNIDKVLVNEIEVNEYGGRLVFSNTDELIVDERNLVIGFKEIVK